jgi:ABC-type sugar transport system ATPase subunit
MGAITLLDVAVAPGDHVVLSGVDLHVDDGEVVALLGRSGSGKTSLLRVVAGFAQPASGRVLVDGRDVTGLPTRRRGLGMVAQGAPLQPTRDVEGNLHLPLQLVPLPGEDVRARVAAEARAFGLGRLLRRRPHQLSTGERHAAATARAMVRQRAALLLDEPVVHLDPHTRAQVLAQIRTVQDGYGTTMLLATNELGVAAALADRVGVLAHGTLAQVAPLAELRRAPRSLDVADLVAPVPLARLTARVLPPRAGERVRLRTAAGDVHTWSTPVREHRGEVLLGIGPHDATLTDPGAGDLTGTVRRVVTTGADRTVTVATAAGALDVRVAGGEEPSVGAAVGVVVRRAVVADTDGRVLAVTERP